jgi:hypothetical protein
MSGQTAADIKGRFESEQNYIRQYIDSLRLGWGVRDGQLFEIQDTLRNHGLPMLYTRPDDRLEADFSPDEIESLRSSMDSLVPSVEAALASYQCEQAGWQPIFTSNGTIETHPTLYSEWANYLFTQLSAKPTREEILAVRANSLRRAQDELDPADRPSDQVLADVIDDALETVADINRDSRIAAMQHILDQFEYIRLVARVATPDSEINVLRQGFILLMTAFDAAIFDLMKVKFRADFFSLIRVFADKDKADLKELGDDGSFEKFRDRIIAEQLKRRYLKDILLILNQLNVQCAEGGPVSTFGHLIELVLRRNVHVHNRGIVDVRYLETDKDGKEKYNVYGFKVGDPATIDEAYWETANRICSDCIARIARWAEA